MYFDNDDILEMQRRDREDEERAQESKRLRELRISRPFAGRRGVGVGPCPCECNRGQFCGGCGHAGCGGRR